MPSVLLATFSLCPDGEPGGDLLGPAGRARRRRPLGLLGRPGGRLGGRRPGRRPLHLGLPPAAAGVPGLGPRGRAAHAAAQRRGRVRLERRQGLPRRPGRAGADTSRPPGRRAARGWPGSRPGAAYGAVVVKPRVGASGVGCRGRRRSRRRTAAGLTAARGWCSRWSTSVRTAARPRSSSSTAAAVSQVDKRPARRRQVRVHEEYGGSAVAVPLDPEADAPRWPTDGAACRRAGRPPRLRPDRRDALARTAGWSASWS